MNNVIEKTTMTAGELTLAIDGFNMACNVKLPGQHFKFLMSLGRVFPTTTTQAAYFVRKGCTLECLNMDDVQMIETLLNKYDMKGTYKYTKSGKWVQLVNMMDLHTAVRKEYLS
jgi:hypothetical protein